MTPVKIMISARSLLLLIAMVLGIIFLNQTKDVFLLMFASFVIASALYPIVDWMSKKMHRGIAVGIVYIAGLLIFVVLSIPCLAVLIEQTRDFLKDFPKYWSHVQILLAKGENLIESTGYIPDYSQALNNISTFGKEIVSQSINLTTNIFVGIAMAFTLAFIVLFLLLDKQEVKKGFLLLFPLKYKEKAELITVTISKKVGGYVRGQLLLMFLVGVLTTASLALVGLEFAFLLGIIAAVLEIVPIVGPVLSAIPAIIIAFAKNPWFALYILGIYLVIQRIENSILAPLILGRFLELHPIIIILAVLIAAKTLGIFGVILSPAIAAAIYVLIQELYLKKINPAETKEPS